MKAGLESLPRFGAMEQFLEQLAVSLATHNALVVYLVGFGVILVCGLGLPVPEDITLLTMGYLTHLPLPDGSPRPYASLALAMTAGFLGCMGGDGIMFAIGRRYGLQVVRHRPFSWVLTPKRIERAKRFIASHGPKVLFAARFMPGIRSVGFFTAGALGTPYFRFVAYDGLAALISVPFFVWAGWYWGDNIDWAISQVRRLEHGMLLVILTIAALMIAKALYGRRRRRAEAE
jgi:membrane protein DedA with SNARE-associated domain